MGSFDVFERKGNPRAFRDRRGHSEMDPTDRVIFTRYSSSALPRVVYPTMSCRVPHAPFVHAGRGAESEVDRHPGLIGLVHVGVLEALRRLTATLGLMALARADLPCPHGENGVENIA